MAFLTVKDLSFTYAGENRPALQDVSFSVEAGEFIVVCGATGSGKSTLLRMLKRELTPMGERSGAIWCDGAPLEALPEREAAAAIGFVMQRPEQQLVTDKVWHELAFGLENLGCPPAEMRRRVAEIAQFFGMEDWFESGVDDLSGGQKQLVNLAAITVMQPKVLILDEPTSRLDPVAASDFLQAVGRLNREMGVTVLLAEHRLEEALPLCSRMLVLRQGSLASYGPPETVCAGLDEGDWLLGAMPEAVQLYHAAPTPDACPITVARGREWLRRNFAPAALPEQETPPLGGEAALEFKDVYLRYDRKGRDILSGTSLTVSSGEIFCLLGGNGSGKTTALSAAAGLVKPYAGTVRVFGKTLKDYRGGALYQNCLAMLPQDVQTVLLRSTVGQELQDAGLDPASLPFDLTGLLDRHPYDLSGGEQQLVALARVLAAKPRLLLLDEPTNGLDAARREELLAILQKLKADGVTVVLVTHDPAFAARAADRCALFFRGSVIAVDAPGRFFSGGSFYTTAVSRITRDHFSGCVTVAQAAQLCRENGRAAP